MIACMRKLLVIVNQMIRNNQKWGENKVQKNKPQDNVQTTSAPAADELNSQSEQTIEEKPTVLLESFFHPRYDLNVFKAAGDFMSLKELLMSKFSVTARRSHERLAVRVPPPRFAALLELPVDTPILRVRRFIWDSADKPLLVSNQYVFTDEWEYEADFTMMM